MSNIAKVKFDGKYGGFTSDKEYFFLTNFDDLTDGDSVLVHSRGSLTIATFTGYADENDVDSRLKMKWIVDKINLSIYHQEVQKEKRKKEIEQEVDDRMRMYRHIKKVRLMAEFDPVIKRLLEESLRLDGKELDDVWQEIDSISLASNFYR